MSIVENDVEGATGVCTLDSTPAVRIGASEGDEAYQLHRVFGARRLSDGRIVVVNDGSKQIRLYDASGRFLTASGREGRGPGEFDNPFYLWILPGDSIWVGDYRPWQFHVFGPDGTWRRTVRPSPQYPNPPGVMEVLDDGRFILSSREAQNRSPTGFTAQTITPVIHAADGTLVDTIGTYPNGRIGNMGESPSGPWMQPHFESYTHVSGSGSRLVIGHGSTPSLSIHRLADSLELERVVRWTSLDRAVTPAAIDAERKRLREQYATLDAAMFRQLVEPLVREDRPAAEMFPAFSGVTLGRDGRIWVREYSTPGGASVRRYLAFDASGRFMCRLAAPAFNNVYEFGKDYLIALERDSLDVERVVMFRMSEPRTLR